MEKGRVLRVQLRYYATLDDFLTDIIAPPLRNKKAPTEAGAFLCLMFTRRRRPNPDNVEDHQLTNHPFFLYGYSKVVDSRITF